MSIAAIVDIGQSSLLIDGLYFYENANSEIHG